MKLYKFESAGVVTHDRRIGSRLGKFSAVWAIVYFLKMTKAALKILAASSQIKRYLPTYQL
jgi:hypothetical protein